MAKTSKKAVPAASKAVREPGSRQKILRFFLDNMNRTHIDPSRPPAQRVRATKSNGARRKAAA